MSSPVPSQSSSSLIRPKGVSPSLAGEYPSEVPILAHVLNTYGFPNYENYTAVACHEKLYKERIPVLLHGETGSQWRDRVGGLHVKTKRSAAKVAEMTNKDLFEDSDEIGARSGGNNPADEDDEEDLIEETQPEQAQFSQSSSSMAKIYASNRPKRVLEDQVGKVDKRFREMDKKLEMMYDMMSKFMESKNTSSSSSSSLSPSSSANIDEGKSFDNRSSSYNNNPNSSFVTGSSVVVNNHFSVGIPVQSASEHFPYVADSVAIESKQGFFHGLHKFIRSLPNWEAAQRERDQSSPEKTSSSGWQKLSEFDSWSSVLGAFTVLQILACEENTSRLLDYTNFIHELTKRVGQRDWPIALMYLEDTRRTVLGSRGRGKEGSEGKLLPRQGQDKHMLSHKIDSDRWNKLRDSLLSDTTLQSEKYHMNVKSVQDLRSSDSIYHSAAKAKATSSTPSVKSEPVPGGVPPAATAEKKMVPDDVFQHCKANRLCIKFIRGAACTAPCTFVHGSLPAELVPSLTNFRNQPRS